MTKPLAATPDPKNGGRKRRSPKLRDGVMKRGSTWYYVIRVRDPETGESKPKWVGGFATEDEAKAARDEARVKARRGEYVDRNAVSVGEYLDEWIEAHAVEIKPKTLKDYKYIIDRYVKPAHRRSEAPSRPPGHHHEAVPRPHGRRWEERPAAFAQNDRLRARGPS